MAIRSDVGQWAMVPKWLFDHPDTKANDLLVYLALSMRADKETGSCWPGHEKIAEDVGLSANTVKRSLANLKKVKAVSWEQRTGTSNVYTVHLAKPDTTSVSDSPSVGQPKNEGQPISGSGGSPSVGQGVAQGRASNYNQELEQDNQLTDTRQAVETTSVSHKTTFEDFPVKREIGTPSAADWDDSPETYNMMANRIAKEFYVALKKAKQKRPAVKHKQMVALLEDLIERGYDEDEIGEIFSAHYKSSSPWTLNSIAFTEAKIKEEKQNEWKPGRESIFDRVLGKPGGE